MRILVLNHNLRERGTWHRAWRIARELGRRGHRVALWTAAPHHYYRPEQRMHGPEDGGVIETETPSWAPIAGGDDGWGPLDVAWRAAAALREPFDLCYAFAHPPNVAVPAWLASRIRRRPLLYDWCDSYAGGVFPLRRAACEEGLAPREPALQRLAERIEVRLERAMPRMAGRVTVISERLRELTRELGVPPEHCLLLPNGANLDTIRPLDREACRRELGLPPLPGPVLGYVANYHPDQELLLGAVAHAARAVPELRLLAAGAPFTAELVAKFALESRIVHLGRQPADRMGTVLGAADALVLPLADNENNRARVPFKFTDYLAAGRPVVTSPVGDLARWFEPGCERIGEAAAPEIEPFGDAIARTLAPGADCDAMGHAARALAEREFAWPGLIDRLEAFISEWLGGREARR